ncbi:hypothetical protein Csa_004381 [Cucumis sativus]|nr:hypothetical protein Csa_004381 [Cucumis sativus]
MATVGRVLSGEGITEYPGKLTPFVTITCIVAAMGGLIFGINFLNVPNLYLLFKKYHHSKVREKVRTATATTIFQVLEVYFLNELKS